MIVNALAANLFPVFSEKGWPQGHLVYTFLYDYLDVDALAYVMISLFYCVFYVDSVKFIFKSY